jgi:hypothetical protein
VGQHRLKAIHQGFGTVDQAGQGVGHGDTCQQEACTKQRPA